MGRRILGIMVAAVVLTGGPCVPRAAADVLPVPAAIHALRTPKEETHALRSAVGAVVGEQRFRASLADDRLVFEVATRFTSGEAWEEHGEMDLAAGFRARRFDKTARRDGRIVQEQHVDFTTGKVAWLVDGVHAERTMTLAPDTYIGPMLAVVLAGVPERTPAAARFAALVFRPDPVVVTLRADAVDEEEHPLGTPVALATKLRVRADLGPVKNVLFARIIPTYYFWFTRADEPAFVGFAGALSNGLEVVMTAATPATATARLGRR
ncbi:MAG: hypothetical protein IT293_20390 [Deltaproteobacteria bacterium]|nr:hypothetical protein [Deltaproteobacteria bacterium]